MWVVENDGFPLTKPMAVNTGWRNCAACDYLYVFILLFWNSPADQIGRRILTFDHSLMAQSNDADSFKDVPLALVDIALHSGG